MMFFLNKIFLIFILSTLAFNNYSQHFEVNYQSNKYLKFPDFIEGVKYAFILLNDKTINEINTNTNGPLANAIYGIVNYYEELGFKNVTWGKTPNFSINFDSFCDQVVITPSWRIENNTIMDFKLTYNTCNNDIFEFIYPKNVKINSVTNISSIYKNICFKLYGFKRIYNSNKRLSLPIELTSWNESELIEHFTKNGTDEIEGIYESINQNNLKPKYKIGIIKIEDQYKVIYLTGAINEQDWKEGEIKAKLIETATPYLYKADWKMANKKENENTYISFEKNLLNLMVQGNDKEVYLKLFPTMNSGIPNNSKSSGTGFALTSNGLIVTNYHVIKDAKKIRVRGIKGDFSISFEAQLVIEDKENDLAIIKIIDPNFSNLGTIPYTISSKISDVGTSVFALGFPLKSLMGDEIKLTNGIVSSKSGYKGDKSSYQISVPLQPGNSGGPLFDNKGNLIGIVNSRLTIGENVSYAIKSIFLLNLITSLPSTPQLQKVNQLSTKTLTEQVKVLNRFVYTIEIN
jgi:S1-C subfamily serine protease